MKLYLGADHRGFKLKEFLREWLMGQGYGVEDYGAKEFVEGDDYTDYATKVASQVQSSKFKVQNYGIVICGSGVGVCVVANKFTGIRCGLGIDPQQVKEAREDDNINVLALAADYTDMQAVKEMVTTFLETKFSDQDRHVRRLKKIAELENKWFNSK